MIARCSYDAVLLQMEQYVKDKQMLHEDVNTGNMLFDKSLGDIELIDWGIWVHQEVHAKPVLHF
jgi:hypothetical protein